MKDVLVTGGAGFVGSHLVETLLKEDVKVTLIDDFSNGRMENLVNIRDRINLIKFDIVSSDWNSLANLNPDTIFHLATHPRSFSLQDPVRNAQVNVIGTLNVLEFARNKKSRSYTLVIAVFAETHSFYP